MDNPKSFFRVPPNPDGMSEAQRRLTALQMRQAGLSWHVIGDALGLTHRQAYNLVMKDLAKVGKVLERRARELHALESERLDTLTTALWPQAVGGSVKAVEALLKVMERRAKLLGLDKPDQVETRSSTVTAVVNFETLSDSELALKFEQLGLPAPVRSGPVEAFLPADPDAEVDPFEDLEATDGPVLVPTALPAPVPQPAEAGDVLPLVSGNSGETTGGEQLV